MNTGRTVTRIDAPRPAFAARQIERDSYGPTARVQALFPSTMTDAEILDAVTRAGWSIEPTTCTHEWDCCGHWYCRGVDIIRRNGVALLSVHWSMNV